MNVELCFYFCPLCIDFLFIFNFYSSLSSLFQRRCFFLFSFFLTFTLSLKVLEEKIPKYLSREWMKPWCYNHIWSKAKHYNNVSHNSKNTANQNTGKLIYFWWYSTVLNILICVRWYIAFLWYTMNIPLVTSISLVTKETKK